jgi:hypothetical protein
MISPVTLERLTQKDVTGLMLPAGSMVEVTAVEIGKNANVPNLKPVWAKVIAIPRN